MPGIIEQTSTPTGFKHITVRKLHPTFGAQIDGVDFSSSLSDEVFNEIRAAAVKVSKIEVMYSDNYNLLTRTFHFHSMALLSSVEQHLMTNVMLSLREDLVSSTMLNHTLRQVASIGCSSMSCLTSAT